MEEEKTATIIVNPVGQGRRFLTSGQKLTIEALTLTLLDERGEKSTQNLLTSIGCWEICGLTVKSREPTDEEKKIAEKFTEDGMEITLIPEEREKGFAVVLRDGGGDPLDEVAYTSNEEAYAMIDYVLSHLDQCVPN
jgi:hypothetical protein